MRTLSILLLISIAACSTSNSDKEGTLGVEPDSLDIPSNAVREKFADSPGMEKITINDAQGTLAAQGTIVNGKREGTWMEFHPGGIVKNVTPFVDGDLFHSGKVSKLFTDCIAWNVNRIRFNKRRAFLVRMGSGACCY